MGKVVKLDNYRAADHVDTPKQEDQGSLVAECKGLKSDLSSLLEGFEVIRGMLAEYSKKKALNLKW